jgi:hypothetical protein
MHWNPWLKSWKFWTIIGVSIKSIFWRCSYMPDVSIFTGLKLIFSTKCPLLSNRLHNNYWSIFHFLGYQIMLYSTSSFTYLQYSQSQDFYLTNSTILSGQSSLCLTKFTASSYRGNTLIRLESFCPDIFLLRALITLRIHGTVAIGLGVIM